MMGRKGEGLSGTIIKDTWTKPKMGRNKGGRWGWLGWEKWWEEKKRKMSIQVLCPILIG